MPRRKYYILISFVGFIVSLDQLTKTIVVSRMQLNESIEVIKNFFNITLIHNSGAAFGLLANLDPAIRNPFFLIIPSLTLLAILYAFHRLKEDETWSIFGLVLIVGGALGNLIDRVRVGVVIDFLDFHWANRYHFPAFNVADSAICIGVGILILNLLLVPEPTPPAASSETESKKTPFVEG